MYKVNLILVRSNLQIGVVAVDAAVAVIVAVVVVVVAEAVVAAEAVPET